MALASGAILAFGSGVVLSGNTVSGGSTIIEVLAGGTDLSATVISGGTLLAGPGGLVSGTAVGKGGVEKVLSGGTASDTNVSSGGALVVSGGDGRSDRRSSRAAARPSAPTAPTSARKSPAAGSSSSAAAWPIGADRSERRHGSRLRGRHRDRDHVDRLRRDVETANGGTAIVSGTVFNSGTLIASGSGSLVEITAGAVVSGGAVEVGNGIVDVLSGGSANVAFLSTGSGGLDIADTNVNSNAFTGTVSGFGGANHANHAQFIDLVSVTSAAHTISFSYISAGGSGTLTVSSGGAVVASIEFIGNYSSGNFHIASGISGTVKITDPGVVNGGSVDTGAVLSFDAHSGIDLPDIAFGAQTTLAYAENGTGNGGTLTVTDGRHAATIALLGNYMAGSFLATADGHGVTFVSSTPHIQQLPQLTHPQT